MKMNAFAVLLLCSVVGSAVGYYTQRVAPYNTGPNDPYAAAVNPNFVPEPSQRLFWNRQGGSNQVGGTGLWGMLTNKYPFLGNMFGRLELPQQGALGQYNDLAAQYGPPARFEPQYYQAQQFAQQLPRQFGQNFGPFGRDVALTDDAVIVTPPQVPIGPQPVPAPAPAPFPVPAPTPSPQPDQGYHYNKPQYRLDLPHK
ncbi:uncharacterized protein LOC113518385 [Galleria mellonella]|uniref:Uncharacterized protein LOC113518385 n=1 Tax=Galleria mellonella TaxID=7137 RepID=A0A6J1WTC5_GALME|nr:uncharacterized protein LOC113518385 [Galleria mellonella]